MSSVLATSRPASRIILPDVPSIAVGPTGVAWVTPDGEIAELSHAQARGRLEKQTPMLAHAPSLAARIEAQRFPAFDVLELFAFVRPARFCLPTPRGLARALGLDLPRDRVGEALVLPEAASLLLAELANIDPRRINEAAAIATTMGKGGWPWTPAVLAALGEPEQRLGPYGGLDVWNRLAEWSDRAPPPPPEETGIAPQAARERLAQLVGPGAEARPAQADYAGIVAHAFAPRDQAGEPNMVLAEAGTGIGKTLGYVAPASLWAERSGSSVWISTYTKNLQRQIDQELDRLYPDPAEKAEKVVIRKGRENYLCLLNLEEAAQGGAMRAADAVSLGLMARWARETRDGDMVGGDFPSWLSGLLGPARTLGLTDQRGECVYSACPHYKKCFIEKAGRKSRHAQIVIANHALVMHQAARGAVAPADRPTRYVFDEGHHVFDAADSTFAGFLSGGEGMDLRRWLRGPEGGRRSRARGLKRRIGDLVGAEESDAARALASTVAAAAVLPAEGWLGRIAENRPEGPAETFLARLRDQVLARARDPEGPYGLETGTEEPVPGLVDAALVLADVLGRLHGPLRALAAGLAAKLDDEAEELDTGSRIRIDAAVRGIDRRAKMLEAWMGMLRSLERGPEDAFVDWLSVERIGGRDVDAGLNRRWIDPTVPFAQSLLVHAHGVLITSATLRDRSAEADEEAHWRTAEMRTGAQHLALPAVRTSLASPFDYANRTRVLVVTDVRREDADQVSAAYRELFLAAGGGALGLFTAIWRLRAVRKKIASHLDEAGIPLLAQHVDGMDTPTLIDIFRGEEDACLLGTDAVRDGVDVPGRSLRLIVFDRVPWPRPDILHRERKKLFGRQAYDDMITRLRLKQAFGRLVRRADDKGVFVMLDAMLPSRLLTAFPPEVEAQRLGLKEAIALTRGFLAPDRP